MQFLKFHHPDLSLPVIRRTISLELMEFMKEMGEFAWTQGRSISWNRSYPNQAAFHAAMYRLRRDGLVVQRKPRGQMPRLVLTRAGDDRLPPYFRPEKFWKKKWNGIWYVLLYDVPEKERAYRVTLRRFLKQKRMGCLQKSVYVTPTDIRPDYADLAKAAGVDSYSFLFESRTVLGRAAREVVDQAWDMDRLSDLQSRYCKIFGENLDLLTSETAIDLEKVIELAREESKAFHSIMIQDPLLPKTLWPLFYKGPEMIDLHRKICAVAAERLSST